MHGRRAQRHPKERTQSSRRGAARSARTAGRMGLSVPPLALYVHFPWCVRKCPYCDFNSYTLQGELEERRYVEALEKDLEAQAMQVPGREVVSIFFGGGTPSLFSPDAIGRVMESVGRHFAVAAD